MYKLINIVLLSGLMIYMPVNSYAVPPVTGGPVIVQHLGKMEWPQDLPDIAPALTQLVHNDINDLHGELSCELIISSPGNYHMALKDAFYGAPELGHIGLIEQVGTPSQFKVSICWSTSPPVSVEQIVAKKMQFKNIAMAGLPSLVLAPAEVMDTLVASGMVDGATRMAVLSNRGNVMLIRADKAGIGPGRIANICDLGGTTRVVTPHPALERGSFENFAGTLFNVADRHAFGCNAADLFNSIYSQKLTAYDLAAFGNPYDIEGVRSVFGRGAYPQGTGPKWVASSKIMHRDIPYALCHDEADAAIIFYHLARYLKATMAATGCMLEIVPLGGAVDNPQPYDGNKTGTTYIAKVNGSYAKKVNDARNNIYNFLTASPVWEQILLKHGMVR